MSWIKVVLGGIVGGVIATAVSFVLHGMVLGQTYVSLPEVFSQEEGNPVWFLLVSLVVVLVAAALFGKTRSSWAPGWQGGLTFGLGVGLLIGFSNFFFPLVIDGLPYYLAWCWLGVDVVTYGLSGVVLGALIPRSP
jgi:NhaP-type Na+/H+ and K+/H+ antiporter